MQSSASRLRDTGFFLPNPRLGRVFANERHSRGFLDSRGKLTGPPSLSRLRASVLRSLHSGRRILSIQEHHARHAHLHATVHFQQRIFADWRTNEDQKPRGVLVSFNIRDTYMCRYSHRSTILLIPWAMNVGGDWNNNIVDCGEGIRG